MSFWVLISRNDGAVIDAYPKGGPKGWRYLEPQPLAQEFQEGLAMRFSSNFSSKRKVYDFVDNILDILIVSSRVRQLILEIARRGCGVPACDTARPSRRCGLT
ncbi:MAG: hypothetical protein QM755_09840 [Luteolibacter sp.]